MTIIKKATRLAVCLTALLVVGCGDNKKQQHIITESGAEWGVRIDVMLVGGGTARLICPKFNSAPSGAHGRECYLDSYDKKDNQHVLDRIEYIEIIS